MAEQMENIRECLKLLSDSELKKMFSEIPTDRFIKLWDELSEEEEVKIFSLLNLDKKLDLINELAPSKQEALITSLSVEHAKVLLEEMEPDDLADFIQAVSHEVRQSVWNSLSDEAKQETQLLLRFDEDDAAGIMNPRFLAVSSSLKIRQAINWVRKNAKNVEIIYYIYVVDQLKRLKGVISLKDILSEEDDELIENIMVKKVISVREETDQEEAAKILETYDLISLPVTDQYNRLLGIITFDDVIDVIREEETEDLYKMGAMIGDTEPYLSSSIWHLVKKRIPWMSILLLLATLTTNVLSFFESLFTATLILFIPTITGTGGNSGTQSSTLIIRGLATGELQFRDITRVLLKEIATGFIIGLALGVLIVIRSLLVPPPIGLNEAVAIGIALSFVVLFATLVGAFAPLFLHKLGFDPAVMAGPLMTTIIDLAGLTIYFMTAKVLLGL
jgi:magnesium transporter